MIDDDLLEGFLTKQAPPIYQQAPPITEHYTNASMEGLLKDLQGGKMMNMQEVITDIETMIAERQTIQKELFSDIDGIIMNLNNFLTAASDKIDTVEQLKLRQKLIEIEEFRMQEKINAFRDIANLKRELRDRTEEFRNAENNVGIIDKLLGE